MKIQYQILKTWRIIAYRRILQYRFLSASQRLLSGCLDAVLKQLVCLVYPNRHLTHTHLTRWRNQTAALFSPELTPLALYAQSTTEAKVSLEGYGFQDNAKLLFISHGAFQIQNVSSLLIELAALSREPFKTVLIFRRQNYPHVEQWWESYGLCFRINIEIIHNDTLALIQRTKELLDDNQIVLCAPDFFFSTDMHFDDALANYTKTVSLYLKIAEQKQADVFYVNCCTEARYTDTRSFLIPVEKYAESTVVNTFQQEISTEPENWFFAYNHFAQFDWSQSIKRHASGRLQRHAVSDEPTHI